MFKPLLDKEHPDYPNAVEFCIRLIGKNGRVKSNPVHILKLRYDIDPETEFYLSKLFRLREEVFSKKKLALHAQAEVEEGERHWFASMGECIREVDLMLGREVAEQVQPDLKLF